MIKSAVKKYIQYPGMVVTDPIRTAINARRRQGWPYCPPDEGDLLYLLAKSAPDADALEVGFATGSTAAYTLSGLGNGKLTSIDYAQDQYEREGVALIASLKLSNRHTLIEENSIIALPNLYQSGQRFSLIFLDGWKTFDHVWVDTFYCAKMLMVDGYIVFDDARMPAVRKCISLLKRYYGFELIDSYKMVGGQKQKLWHLLTTHTLLRPYVVLRKISEISDTEAGKNFCFWRSF